MYAHCKKIYGLNFVVSKHETDVPIDTMFADFKTGNITDALGGTGGHYTGTPVNGSVDGQIVKNFKAPVLESIDRKTDNLIAKGLYYNGKHFYINVEKEVSAIVMFLERLIGSDMTGKMFRATGEDYTFLNNDDFDAWFATGSYLIQSKIRSGAELKNDVSAAGNSDAGMASIIGANNART